MCQRYRIDPASAQAILEEHFLARADLLRKLHERHAAEDVTRWSAYKQVIKQARKQVYYQLRQYHADKEQARTLTRQLTEALHTPEQPAPGATVAPIVERLLHVHVSTRERMGQASPFHQALADLAGCPHTILDVGCGLYPLSYLSQAGDQRPDLYVAMDKDPEAVAAVAAFAPLALPTTLVALLSDLETLNWQEIHALLPAEKPRYDLALLLKLVPVVYRQNRSLLPALARLPAERVLITASAESMTRRQDISRREDRVLREFIALTGRRVVGHLHIAGEFGYLLQ
jgi:16S rRNA (guanine(1405)-N(7))-methyltransferase